MSETSPPRFSILTPAYNAEGTIGRAIESVIAQTVDGWEHVIIDDGSTDGTLRIAESYAVRDSRIRVVPCQHRGLTASRIESMEQAHGELFARLDADDEMAPEYLERVDAVFGRHPDADIVSTNGYQVLADGRQVYYYKTPVFQKESSLTISQMLSGSLFGTSAVMRRRVYDLTGGPRPSARSEDIDLWLRAIAMGAVHYHLPEPVFRYYQDAKNPLSSDVEAVWRSHIEILQHLIDEGLLSDADVVLARRAIRRSRLKLGLRWHRWGIPVRRTISRFGKA